MPATTSQSALPLVHNDDAKQMQIESRTCQACLGKENANREQCQTCLNIAEVQLFFYHYAEMQLRLSIVTSNTSIRPIWFVSSPLWFVNAAFCTSKHPTTVKHTRQVNTFRPKHLHDSNKSRTFATTESATLPVRSANQGGSFAFIPMVRIYTKLPLSITDQVALLKSRGLQFADEVAAEKLLSEVCYFRFVQYLRPMEADKIVHTF